MTDQSWDDLRPQLADGVTVDAPAKDGDPWIIAVSAIPRARVSAEFAHVVCSLDGHRSLHEAVDFSGIEAGPEEALGVVAALRGGGFLVSGSSRAASRRSASLKSRKSSRLRVLPPLTIQLTLFDPSRAARALAAPLRHAGVRRVAATLLAAVIVLAAVAVVRHSSLLVGVLSSPLPLELLPALLIAVLITGGVHEFGHAVALATVGGRPSRMGAMLFYALPAFFCDVTDGWRLGSRRRRLIVAVAGPIVHLTLGAASLACLLIVGDGEIRTFFVLYAGACLAATAANLLPFIKLDGYFALVAATDTPHLRSASIAAFRRWSGIALFGVDLNAGAKRASALRVLFGALCLGFPLALFVWGAFRLQPSFVAAGPWAAMAYIALVLAFTGATLFRMFRFFAACMRRHPRPPRVLLALCGSLTVAVVLAVVAVPSSDHVGFVVQGHRVLLTAATSAPLRTIRPGMTVRLLENGIVFRPELGTGTIAEASPLVRVDVPLVALAPVSSPELSEPGWGRPLSGLKERLLPPAGTAEIETGSQPIGALVIDRLFVQPVRTLVGKGEP